MDDYPGTVCIECLDQAVEDTLNYKGLELQWSNVYSVYTTECDVCGLSKPCTEPRDAGYPNFDYHIKRLKDKKRLDKINKLYKNDDNS